jgi:protein-disulfide isomerase
MSGGRHPAKTAGPTPSKNGPGDRGRSTSRVPSKNERARAAAASRLAAQRASERRRRAILASAVALAVLAVVAFIGVTVYLTGRPDDKNIALPKDATNSGVTVGIAHATVTVDIYLDFQCPYCKDFESKAGQTLQKYVDDGTAKIRYHPVAYLDRFSSGTKYSTRSSAAAGCASDAGKLSEFVTAVYANQPAENGNGLTNDRMVQVAQSGGVTGDAFAQCVRDQKYADWTASVTDKASKAGFVETPTVRVAGTTIENPDLDNVSAAIDAAAAGK